MKVAPSDDEKRKFQKFDGNLLSLGPADRFFHAILEVPSAWSRFNAMLYQAQYKEELSHVQESLATLEVGLKFKLRVPTVNRLSSIYTPLVCLI